jgi:DNA modification methylase
MKIEQRKVESLIPYVNNSRKHSDEQVAQIAASIKEFGWTNPILVDGENGIIAGHGRLMAARKLEMDKVPVIELAHLSEAQRKALVIADNKLALNADWDNELLALEMMELKELDFNLDLVGFSGDEIDALAPKVVKGLTDEDEVPEPPPEPVTKLGDIWILGNHRLMCGDSTSIDAVDKLMDGNRPDMVFTDPPYNIDYQGVKDKREKIKNDKMSDEAFKDFLIQSLYSCETMYVCCSWQYAHIFKDAMESIGRKPKAMIVWDKINPAQHLDKYFKQHELIFYYGDFGGHKTVRGDVWSLKRQKNTVHPTMKPVELIELALNDQAGKSVVLDCFGGSGSTLIACEKTGRKARVMELDPIYCDVIVKRWENFTGKKAIHEQTGLEFTEVNNAIST